MAASLEINDITGLRMAHETLKSAAHVAKDACTDREQTDSMQLQINNEKNLLITRFFKKK